MLPSVVFINGSFGAGKTGVARELRRRVSGSAIYDPEWTGWVIQRLPSWVHLLGRGTDDFQDVDLWRNSVATGTRIFRALARGPVFVPMTFSNLEYLECVLSRIRSFEPNVRVFCLLASLETIRKRIRDRNIDALQASWVLRRAEECVRAHSDPAFGERVDTEGRSIMEIAEGILEQCKRAG